ncbi:unnamed protein product, partial [Protopolystoma xenopodis]
EHCYIIASDYASSCRDVARLVQKAPARTLVILSSSGIFSFIWRNCPTEDDYYDSLITASHDIWSVPQSIRNPSSYSYVCKRIEMLESQRLRTTNFGLFRVAWWEEAAKECCLYSEKCIYRFPANGGGDYTSLLRFILFDVSNSANASLFVLWSITTSILANGTMIFSPNLPSECFLSWPIDDNRTHNKTTLPEADHRANDKPTTSTDLDYSKCPNMIKLGDLFRSESDHAETTFSESEWEVIDEEIIYSECKGALEPGIIKSGQIIRFVDLDSECPIAQIGPAVFKGTYTDTVGTILCFAKTSNLTNAEEISLKDHNVVTCGKTPNQFEHSFIS